MSASIIEQSINNIMYTKLLFNTYYYGNIYKANILAEQFIKLP